MTQDTKLFIGADNPDIKSSDFKKRLAQLFMAGAFMSYVIYSVWDGERAAFIFPKDEGAAFVLLTAVCVLWAIFYMLFQ